MGLQVGEIIPKEEIALEDLNGKVIAIDAFNVLYQFITTIRQADGQPLMDSNGNVTSHLSGIFYRVTNMLSMGIKPVFVFDGKAPALKAKTQEKRREYKMDMAAKFETAESFEDKAKYAARTSYLTETMIEESKDLLTALGVPYVQAPSEGEAQAAYMVAKGDAWAVGSQDYDALLFGATRLIQNLTLSKTRKLANGAVVQIRPQMIELKKVLEALEVSRDQLISLGILVGSDYNPGGIKGIGQKTALKLVKMQKSPAEIFEEVRKTKPFDFDWNEIYQLFIKPDVTSKYLIKFEKIDISEVKKIMMKHEFSEERIDLAVDKVYAEKDVKKQKRLGNF